MVELTRRTLLRSTGAAGAVVAYGALGSPASPSMARLAPPAGAWNHNPSSRIGPLRWADIGFPTCGQGTSQSPVNISTRNLDAYRGAPLRLGYRSSDVVVENTGHVVEVPIPEGVHDTLEIGNDSYELTQYHFHAPSEHTVNGRSAAVEAHFVHVNDQGAIAVVGVFYNLGQPRNKVLERILLSAPGEEGEETHAGHASPADLFDRIDGIKVTRDGLLKVRSFYAYDGSLTTPGCDEAVRWSVLANGGNVSPAAVEHLHRVIADFPHYRGYENNNRPVQPLNGRVVKHRRVA